MCSTTQQRDFSGRLERKLQIAETLTPALFVEVVAQSGLRLAARGGSDATRIQDLVAVRAWSEAALALLDRALPRFALRVIAHEDGEWRCTLGRVWQLPEWLDDTVEARHALLPLAILLAFVRAGRASRQDSEAGARTVPEHPLQTDAAAALCCENFS